MWHVVPTWMPFQRSLRARATCFACVRRSCVRRSCVVGRARWTTSTRRDGPERQQGKVVATGNRRQWRKWPKTSRPKTHSGQGSGGGAAAALGCASRAPPPPSPSLWTNGVETRSLAGRGEGSQEITTRSIGWGWWGSTVPHGSGCRLRGISSWWWRHWMMTAEPRCSAAWRV